MARAAAAASDPKSVERVKLRPAGIAEGAAAAAAAVAMDTREDGDEDTHSTSALRKPKRAVFATREPDEETGMERGRPVDHIPRTPAEFALLPDEHFRFGEEEWVSLATPETVFVGLVKPRNGASTEQVDWVGTVEAYREFARRSPDVAALQRPWFTIVRASFLKSARTSLAAYHPDEFDSAILLSNGRIARISEAGAKILYKVIDPNPKGKLKTPMKDPSLMRSNLILTGVGNSEVHCKVPMALWRHLVESKRHKKDPVEACGDDDDGASAAAGGEEGPPKKKSKASAAAASSSFSSSAPAANADVPRPPHALSAARKKIQGELFPHLKTFFSSSLEPACQRAAKEKQTTVSALLHDQHKLYSSITTFEEFVDSQRDRLLVDLMGKDAISMGTVHRFTGLLKDSYMRFLLIADPSAQDLLREREIAARTRERDEAAGRGGAAAAAPKHTFL